ncbi:MAG: sigma-70 family RNA polymerase sigma factor [Hyphomicrobiaceae bacterium]|nr:sigma-70 family RNA polymerase sigma factor [Hyphomicrobiaceae bacterium]
MALSATQVNRADHDHDNDFVALMARVRERDRHAFERVFTHFGPRVKALMLKSGADQALAEDIVQDVFMSVWRRAGQYVPERGSVSAWIFTIARNARIDRLRRQSSRPYEDVTAIEIADDGANAEQQLDAAQRAERVASAMVELPREQRVVIELAYVHDLAQSEIASNLSLPLGTVKSRMRLAYAKLKQKLEETV